MDDGYRFDSTFFFGSRMRARLLVKKTKKTNQCFTVILHDHYQNVGTVNQIASDIYGKTNNSY